MRRIVPYLIRRDRQGARLSCMAGKRRVRFEELTVETPELDLQAFFPYQARIFYKSVTDAVSKTYETAYNMKPYEWRTMVILGHDLSLTPAEIVERSSMDKVSISRAVSALTKRGWLDERSHCSDGRSKVLSLSRAGTKVYDDLVPKMLAVEEVLLSPLSGKERKELRRLMAKVRLGAGGAR